MNAIKHLLLLAAMTVALPLTASAQSQAQVAEGAKAWARNCTRCHNARPSTERTDRQWETIVAHMRARANLTKTDATLVAVFLKATNGMPTVVAAEPVPAPVSKPEPDDDPGDDAGDDPGDDPGDEPAVGSESSETRAEASTGAILLPDGTTLSVIEVAALARYLRALTLP